MRNVHLSKVALAVLTGLNVYTAAAQTSLTNGLSQQGNLASSTDFQTWSFPATSGDRISVTVAKSSGGANFNPRIEARGPAGEFLGAANGSVAARLDLQADGTGTYIITVTDAFHTGNGAYQVRLAQIPEPFTVAVGDEGGGMTNGASHQGTITAGDLDMWTLSANPGERIVLQVSKLTGGAAFSPQLELFDPTGTRIGADSGVTAGRIDAQAPLAGNYTIVVSAMSPDATGTYQLQLVHAPGVISVPTGDEGGPLADGVDQSGTISVGDLDPWTFDAAVGDRITLSVSKQTGGAGFTPQLELIAPNGDRRTYGQGSSLVTLDTAITMAGTYVALVSDASETGSGTYTLHLTRATINTNAALLVNGPTVQSSIAVAGQTNTWNILASVNDRLILRVGKIGTGTFTPSMRLIGPTGIALGAVNTSSAAEIAVTATNTGAFTVTVSDGSAGHNQTGGFRLTLVHPGLPASLGANDEGGGLTNGLTTSGIIDQGDLDVWTFTANSGQELLVRMGELTAGSTLTPSLRLYSPDGILLDQYGASGTAAEVEFRATNSGTFTVVAGDNSSFFTGTGGYRLKVLKTGSALVIDPNDEGGSLTNGTTLTGSIPVGDMDGWSFRAQSGQSIVLGMGELVANSSLTPFLRLYGPDGALIGQYGASGTASEVSARATNSGTFTVVAADASGFYLGSGTYTIKLAKTGSPIVLGANDSGGPITNGVMHTGSLSVGNIEIWNFDATEGDSIVARMGELLAGSSLTPFLRIYGPDGALLDQYGSSSVAAEVSTRATNSGTFTIITGDASGFFLGSGGYRVKLGKTGSPIFILPTDEGGPMTNGWLYTGNIDVGDMDVWSFNAVAGQSIVLRMGELIAQSSLTPYLRLFGPDGALLGQYGSSGSASEVTTRATNSGVFTVIAADATSFYQGSGTYRLKLAQTATPLLTQAGDDGGAMHGQTNYDGLLNVGDVAAYEFTACAGDPISLSLTKVNTGSTLTPWLRLYGRDGTLLKNVSSSPTATASLTAPASGIYTVVVADGSGFFLGSGNFTLNVNGLARGLAICIPSAGDTNIIVTGAQTSSGFNLLTTTNVETPKASWDLIPATQFDSFGNLNYPVRVNPDENRRFFRWLAP
jgi:trimeric autotransporter adhesin